MRPESRRRLLRLVCAAAVVIGSAYMFLTVSVALHARPWCDEAWYASPARNLIAEGHMGTSILEPTSSPWRNQRLNGVDRHTYLAVPLHFLAQAAWYKLFGFSLLSLRLMSVAWGLVALASWAWLTGRLTSSVVAGIFAALLLGTDYFFIVRAADGRMDMMSAALAVSSVLAYILLRKRNITGALACGHSFAAMSLFTHPNGGIMAIIGLTTCACIFDRRRLRYWHAALMSMPYLIGGAVWAVYIWQDPQAFRAQFLSSAAARWNTNVWKSLELEVRQRYLQNFGWNSWSVPSRRILIAIPAAYAAAIVLASAVRELRRDRGVRVLLVMSGAMLAYMTFAEGLKTYLYMIYIVPLLTALLASVISWLWYARPAARPFLLLAAAGLVLLQISRTAVVIKSDPYHKDYLPAVAWLAAHTSRGDMIMGSGELAFGLGFDRKIVDDIWLGYSTGKRPEYIVLDEFRYKDNLEALALTRPAIHAYTSALLREAYEPVYEHGHYRILRRRRADAGN